MAPLKLTDYERQLCIEVVSKRLQYVKEFYSNSMPTSDRKKNDPLNLAGTILASLERKFENLTSMQKAFLSGCLMEHIIDNNEKVVNFNEFDFLIDHNENDWQSKYLRYDTAANLKNRLSPKSRKEYKYRLIRPIQDKIRMVLESDKILYSISGEKIYKIAIYNAEIKKFWKIETDSYSYYDRINFSPVHNSYINSYSGSGSPSEILHIINVYEKRNELEWGQIKFKQLIEKMVESKLESILV